MKTYAETRSPQQQDSAPARPQPSAAHTTRDTAQLQRQSQADAQPRINRTGMPDGLLSRLEAASGFDMSDVRVHRNSSKPAQLQAHAYAQGTNIYLGPGQERHLPHEAWHVVQQKQGRVRATRQFRGVGLNDDVGLEREADGWQRSGHQRKKQNRSTWQNSMEGQSTVQRVLMAELTGEEVKAKALQTYNNLSAQYKDKQKRDRLPYFMTRKGDRSAFIDKVTALHERQETYDWSYVSQVEMFTLYYKQIKGFRLNREGAIGDITVGSADRENHQWGDSWNTFTPKNVWEWMKGDLTIALINQFGNPNNLVSQMITALHSIVDNIIKLRTAYKKGKLGWKEVTKALISFFKDIAVSVLGSYTQEQLEEIKGEKNINDITKYTTVTGVFQKWKIWSWLQTLALVKLGLSVTATPLLSMAVMLAVAVLKETINHVWKSPAVVHAGTQLIVDQRLSWNQQQWAAHEAAVNIAEEVGQEAPRGPGARPLTYNDLRDEDLTNALISGGIINRLEPGADLAATYVQAVQNAIAIKRARWAAPPNNAPGPQQA